MNIELISFKTCPYVQRSVIVLREKGIPFDINYIDINNKPDWFLDISPLGLVPVLRVDDEVLFESAVINEFLDETHPPSLHPADPLLRAKNRAWIAMNGEFNAANFGMVNAQTEEEFDQKREAAAKLYVRLEQQLAARPEAGDWFNGPAFSLVDASYAPTLMRLGLLEDWFGLGLLAPHPAVRAWAGALAARDSVVHSVVGEFPDLYRRAIVMADGYLKSRLA